MTVVTGAHATFATTLGSAATATQILKPGAVLIAAAHTLANGTAHHAATAFSMADAIDEQGWPQQIAGKLLSVSVAENQRTQTSPEFTFAAVCMDGSVVRVCWCGDVRVHLIGQGTVRATVDHTVQFAPDDELPPGEPSVIRNAVPTMLTRWISANQPSAAETVTWKRPTGGSEIVICSNGYHRHDKPGNPVPKQEWIPGMMASTDFWIHCWVPN
mgnify:CR=1 FL=1